LAVYESRKEERLVGIGLQTETDPQGRLRVVGALEGSPADSIGLSAGDELLQVDDRGAAGLVRDSRLENALRGEEGSTVRLAILESSGRRRDLRLTRREVNVSYLSAENVSRDILLLRITWFSSRIHEEFIDVLESAESQGIKAVVLDIRANSGGSIIATRQIFSSFCGEATMYYVRNREQGNIPDTVLGKRQFSLPLAVLIDGETYSAGEVLAGALQDYKRAIVVGSRSGGRGSMQQVFPIGGALGGALRVTTAANRIPSGREIQGNGIEPDLEVRQPWPRMFVEIGPQNLPEEARRYQRDLKREKLAAVHGRDPVDAVWQAGDRQLAIAVQYLREHLLSR
jgi:carboxyl-terminal processing protease